jgi:penicillin-binding protein 2
MPKKENPDFVIDAFVIRVGVLALAAFLLFSVLVIRLWNMQVVGSSEYEYKDRKQSARRIRIPAMRGEIFGRDGTAIVRNRPSFNVLFHPGEMTTERSRDRAQYIMDKADQVAAVLGRYNPLTLENVRRHLNYQPGLPLTAFKDLSDEERGRLDELFPPIRGLEVTAEPMREYPFGSLAAQLIGYVGNEDPGDADDRREYFYYLPSLEGRSGLEYQYNDKLSGKAGSQFVMVNSNGFVHEQLEEPTPPENGYDLRLTLDIDGQIAAERALSGHLGAIVVLSAESGAVRVMASSPTFSPADFVPSISRVRYRELVEDPGNPFLNRAVQGSYMPGSTIKPLTALAALENGIPASKTYDCEGITPHGYGGGIHCTGIHRELDMRHAIMKSCNVYFVDLGVDVGINALSRMFASAGIGSKTGIEIAERAGYLPKDGPNWNENETAYVSIGQGKVEVTPLQAAVFYAAIANGGTMYKPYLIDHIYDHDRISGSRLSVFDAVPLKTGRLAASAKSLDVIREGMYLVVHDSGGSGRRGDIKSAELYAKTGTANVGTGSKATKNTWFNGFVKHPRTGELLAFAAVIEHGESGGGTTAPIVAGMLTEWFSRD